MLTPLPEGTSDWVRDNWNYPSLVIWDTCNETHDPVFGDEIIPTVRKLDLSNRYGDSDNTTK